LTLTYYVSKLSHLDIFSFQYRNNGEFDTDGTLKHDRNNGEFDTDGTLKHDGWCWRLSAERILFVIYWKEKMSKCDSLET
jgi:CRISPR/Cas system CMR-associated protein Cmr5 small subunit